MKSITTKTFITAIACMIVCQITSAADITFSYSEILAGATKSGITVSTDLESVNKQVCKENNQGKKVDLIEIKSTANTYSEKYVGISSTSDITAITFHGTTNIESAKDAALLMWDNATPSGTEATDCALINFSGYSGSCADNYTSYNISRTGIKSLRLYRQIKKFDPSTKKFGGSKNYGEGQTIFIVDITVTIGGGSVTPVAVTGVSLDKTTLELEVGDEATLKETVSPDNATNKGVEWSSDKTSIADVDQNGKVSAKAVGNATITVKTKDGSKTATCAVTVKAATADRPLQSISIPDKLQLTEGSSSQLTVTYTPTNTTTDKKINWSSNNTAAATVSSNGTVTAVKAGTATITAEADADKTKTAQCVVTVVAATPVPPTDLTLHVPEVYEKKRSEGGYGTPLAVFNSREYEVYYINRDAEGDVLTIATSNVDKAGSITDDAKATENTAKAKDGWAEIKCNKSGGDANAKEKDEFQTSLRCTNMSSKDHYLELHIEGYDQFSFYGKDNSTEISKGRYFEVYIDDVKQTVAPLDGYAIHRYDITKSEHVIRVVGKSDKDGSNESKLCSFSLRLAKTPRVKYLLGNDTTQNVLVTAAMKDVLYTVKYNEDTRLQWEGNQATGISLSLKGKGEVIDTFAVAGTPLCPAGDYTYKVITYSGSTEANSITGKLHVSTKIETKTATNITGYVDEDIDEIKLRYYAYQQSDVTVTWPDGKPTWIKDTHKDNVLTLSGVPDASAGGKTFKFKASVAGGNIIDGEIKVISSELGSHPILYLYKSDYENSAYSALKEQSFNPVPRTTKSELRSSSQYGKYELIVISEDVDANNEEVLGIIKSTSIKQPVLNMKSFTYTRSRLGWGYPDNGSTTATEITVLQPNHPVFNGMGAKENGKIKILSSVNGRGLMPVEIDNCAGSYALATAKTQGLNPDKDGDDQTFIHEVPSAKRGAKYILFPISQQSAKNLTSNGKTLLKNIVDYLLSSEQPQVSLPELAITKFSIDGHDADINESTQEIRLQMPAGTDLTQLKPQITLASDKTSVSPASGSTLDMSDSFFGVTFTVCDFINRKAYTAYITTPTALDDTAIEGVWFDGNTLHNPEGKSLQIYTIAGAPVTFTNTDFTFSGMPASLYLVVSAEGSMKVLTR